MGTSSRTGCSTTYRFPVNVPVKAVRDGPAPMWEIREEAQSPWLEPGPVSAAVAF